MSRVARSSARVVAVHEAFAAAVEQVPAGAAQAFLEDRAGHPRAGAGEQAGGVELHHLHVAQRQPGAQRHGQPVAALVARGRVVLVHRRPAAGGQQHRPRLHEHEAAVAHVDQQHAGQRAAVGGLDELDGAVLLQPRDAARPHLLGQAVDDLDAGQVALVHRAVEGLAGEGLLVHAAVGVAVEEAAELVLELVDALDGLGHQRPRQILVGQPLAALDGVHEVALDRIARGQRHVVAALDHARAAALAEQALDRDRDRQLGRGLVRVQRREQAGAAGAEDQDVGLQPLDRGCRHTLTPRPASTAARRDCASSRTTPYRLPAMAVHGDEQRPEIADAELPQRLGVQVVEVDVLDLLDPGRLQRRGATDDRQVGAAELG